MNDSRDQDFKPEWTKDATFEDGPVIVTVSKSNHRSPRYSIQVEFKGAHNPVRSFRPQFERKDGQVTIERALAQVSSEFAKAEDYIQKKMQEAQDEWVRQQERRPAKGPGGFGGERPGLKKLAKMDKAKALARKAAAEDTSGG